MHPLAFFPFISFAVKSNALHTCSVCFEWLCVNLFIKINSTNCQGSIISFQKSIILLRKKKRKRRSLTIVRIRCFLLFMFIELSSPIFFLLFTIIVFITFTMPINLCMVSLIMFKEEINYSLLLHVNSMVK